MALAPGLLVKGTPALWVIADDTEDVKFTLIWAIAFHGVIERLSEEKGVGFMRLMAFTQKLHTLKAIFNKLLLLRSSEIHFIINTCQLN